MQHNLPNILQKKLNNFVPSVVDARREGYENPLAEIFAEIKKLLGSFSYGYQIMDGSWHTIRNSSVMIKPIRQSMKHCFIDRIQLKKTCMRETC